MKVKKSITLNEETVERLELKDTNLSKAIEKELAIAYQNQTTIEEIETLLLNCQDTLSKDRLIKDIFALINFNQQAQKLIKCS